MGDRAKWPGGLNDEEAVTRLQTVLIAACEGNRDVTANRDYTSIRTPLLKRADLADVMPSYIRPHRDLNSLWSYLKGVSDQWQPRREHIWETFRPLLDRVEGLTKPPAASSSWTGNPTSRQAVIAVRALAPTAMEGVDYLIGELEKLGGNGSPDADQVQEALNGLRELRDALSTLIDAAAREAALDQPITHVKGCAGRLLKWSKSNYEVSLAGLGLWGLKATVAIGVGTAVNRIYGIGGEAAGAAASEMIGSVIQPKAKK